MACVIMSYCIMPRISWFIGPRSTCQKLGIEDAIERVDTGIPHEGDGVTNKLNRVTNIGFWGRQRGFLANPEFRGNILGWL